MVEIYANILGDWTKLHNDNIICGATPESFFEKYLKNSNLLSSTSNFVDITIGKEIYYIHISQIQYVGKN